MKKAIILFSLTISSFAIFAQQGEKVFFAGGNICQTESWKLVFQDEFSGNSLNQSKWYMYYPYGPNNSDQCQDCRTHGNEGQIYLDQNVVVDNGTLKLIAKKESATWLGANRDFTSGMVHSKINNLKYEKFEIRCKIPSGTGFWPAFWTFGGDEIDVFEFGTDVPTEFYSDVHNWNWNGSHVHDGQTHTGVDFSSGFHTFAIEWDHFFLKWFLDGTLVRTVPKFYTLAGNAVAACDIAPDIYLINPLFPTDPTSVIANLAIGGPFTPMPNASTPFPSSFEIDYIRVYQRTPQTGFVDICETQNTITGLDAICNNNDYTYQFNGPTGAATSWSVSPNLQIIANNSNSITVKTSANSTGQAWIKAFFNSTPPCPQTEITKSIWIGGKPTASVSVDDKDWCSVYLSADVQPSNLVGTWAITKNGVTTTTTGNYAIIDGLINSSTNWSYVYTVSNNCGVTTATGGGLIPKCGKPPKGQLVITPNPVNDLMQIELQGDLLANEIESVQLVSMNYGLVNIFYNTGIQFTISTLNLNEGLYSVIVKIFGSEYPLTKTIQIQH